VYDTLGGHTAARMVGDTFDVGRKTRFGSIKIEASAEQPIAASAEAGYDPGGG